MELFLLVLVVLIFTQLVIWYQNDASLDRREKYKSQEPLCSLPQLGFEPNSRTDIPATSISYEGLIDGYRTEILFDWQTGWWKTHPHYSIKIYYLLRPSGVCGSKPIRTDDTWTATETSVEKQFYIGRFGQIAAPKLLNWAKEGVSIAKKLTSGHHT